MVISEADRYKIILHLGLPKSEKVKLWTLLDTCQTESADLVARITQIIKDLDAVRATAVKLASKQAGLKAARHLEWDTEKICCMVGHGHSNFSRDLANLIGYDLTNIPFQSINAF